MQSLGAEYARSLEEAQKADFIVVDLDFVKANASDNTDLYHLQPEWWRVYAPGLVTELLGGAQHEVRCLRCARPYSGSVPVSALQV